MKAIEALEKEVWERIVAATSERDTRELNRLNMIASRLARIRDDLVDIELEISGEAIFTQAGKDGPQGKGMLPPNGTLLRFRYKNTVYSAEVVSDYLKIDRLGYATSLSNASKIVTGTVRNGWNDWEIRLPGETAWMPAHKWRLK